MTATHVIGIDEVGWGCIAGPLVVCAASVPFGHWEMLRAQGFRDSKKVGNKPRINENPNRKRTQRSKSTCAELARWLNQEEQRGLATWAIAQVEVTEFDAAQNPLEVKDLAFWRALVMLTQANGWDMRDVDVIVDGDRAIPMFPSSVSQAAFPNADDEFMPASVASIIAKAHRDEQLVHLGKQYPGYGFEQHMGYGTQGHIEAVIKLGPIKGIHRINYTRSRARTYYEGLKDSEKARKNPPAWLYGSWP